MDTAFDLDSAQALPFQEPLHLVPSWEKQIQLVGHLCQYSENALVLLGNSGTGKTSFAKLLKDYKIPGVQKMLIDGAQIANPDQLMDKISQCYEQAQHINPNALIMGEEPGVTWAVVVDNADSLSVDTLRALLKLIDYRLPTKQQLHVVLLAEPSFEAVMQSEEITQIIEDKIHPLELDSWHEEDIEYLLDKQGKAVSSTFAQTLLEQSRGLPKSLLDSLAFVEPPEIEKGPTFSFAQMNKPVLYGVSLGLFCGFAFLILSFSEDEVVGNPPVNVALEHDKVVEPFELVFRHEQVNNPQPKAQPSARVEAESMPDPWQTQQEPEQSFDTLAQVFEAKPVANNQPKAAQKTESDPQVAVNTRSAPSQKAQALLGQGYTLQLSGSRKSPDIDAFLRTNKLDANAKVVRTSRSGKEWYVIIYGTYSSYEQAKKAARAIESDSKLKPWIRSYKSIQSDVDNLAKIESKTEDEA